ncbi:MAG: cyclohexa-1,5-dienecarbonyl-CoA hydratase [Gammaproteobacteria bacterium]|nr:cyclohexa-1,5-dienecarbonyl-CoA hydratase [Gammaproteobacteria bacterium]
MSDAPLKVWSEREGQLLRLRLARPKANIIDAAMVDALNQAFSGPAQEPALKAVLLDAEGPHFSFGASVEEHLPEQCAAMLQSLHRLLLQMLECPVPVLVAIRGQCLGGGLEVACAGTVLFAADDAQMGQPEIRIAVFAPAASCLLPERIGRGAAEELLLSGRSCRTVEAYRLGLVNQIAENPESAALTWFDKHLAGSSGSSLRFALRATRMDFIERIRVRLEEAERLYLDDLMSTHDAEEGLTAFIEKRTPVWQHK